jgi:hypothetical protein
MRESKRAVDERRVFSRLQEPRIVLYRRNDEQRRVLFEADAGRPGKGAGLQRGGFMAEKDQQAALIREIQTRFERKVKDNEISLLEYWKEQLDHVTAMKPEGVAALQTQIRKVSEMMANRIRTLKREG